MLMMNARTLLAPVALVLTVPTLFAADYLGAEAALARIAAEIPAAKTATQDHEAILRQHAEELAKLAATLPPTEAAQRWIQLLEETLTSASESNRFSGGDLESAPKWSRLMAALPPPAAWEALDQAAKEYGTKAKNAGAAKSLRLLTLALRGDLASLPKAIEAMEKGVPQEQRGFFDYALNEIKTWISQGTANPKAVAEAFTEHLDGIARREFAGDLPMPDLVTLVGAEKAAPLIRRALLSPQVRISVPVGDATRALAVKIAKESVDELKSPPWALIAGIKPDDLALYVALDRKFPKNRPKEDPRFSGFSEYADSNRAAATRYYLFGLIAAGRTEEAVKIASELADQSGTNGEEEVFDSDSLEQLNRAGLTPQTLAVLREVLKKNPALRLWGDYINLSAQAGTSRETLAFLRETEKRTDLNAQARSQIKAHLWAALLAADEVEEGVLILREVLKQRLAELAEKPKPAPQQRVSFRFHDDETDTIELGLKLASLGRLLNQPEWVEEGLQASKKALAKASPEKGYLSTQVTEFLSRAGRGPEAEQLLIEAKLARIHQEAERKRGDSNFYISSNSDADSFLKALAEVYHKAGRSNDVLRLLSEAKDWQIGDLAEESGGGDPSLSFIAAHALAKSGRREEARQLVLFSLSQRGGYDPAYALLLELGGDDLIAQLDRLAAQDRFEERPLIWKAKIQLEAGQLDAAEKTIRAAIAIDPSDGEQGKGDRMRAYAVLGDILDKKGDAAQAKTMRGAVAAIRLSEDADDWWMAGLLTRAVKKYEEALGLFADAYCIQSRLALRYAELGNNAKAEEHYRRAYELMPASFGRVESHCFGCEGAFRGERAQNIADRVFSQLAVTLPDKPQIFYLLGYLRAAQERWPEAAENYRRATQLDPDYFNAWEKLAELGQKMALPQTDQEAAVLAMWRLDTTGHRSGVFGYQDDRLKSVTNFRALWPLLEEHARHTAATPTQVFPLPASKREIERKAAAEKQDGADAAAQAMMRAQRRPQPATNAGQLMLQHPYVNSVVRLVSQSAAQ